MISKDEILTEIEKIENLVASVHTTLINMHGFDNTTDRVADIRVRLIELYADIKYRGEE